MQENLKVLQELTGEDKKINLSNLNKNNLQDILNQLFYIRDIKYGFGRRNQFKINIQQILEQDSLLDKQTLDAIINFTLSDRARPGDLLDSLLNQNITLKTKQYIINLLWNNLHTGTTSKWMPSKSSNNKKNKLLVAQICKLLNISKKQYRQELTKYRKNLNLIEQKLTNRKKIKVVNVTRSNYTKYKNCLIKRKSLNLGKVKSKFSSKLIAGGVKQEYDIVDIIHDILKQYTYNPDKANFLVQNLNDKIKGLKELKTINKKHLFIIDDDFNITKDNIKSSAIITTASIIDRYIYNRDSTQLLNDTKVKPPTMKKLNFMTIRAHSMLTQTKESDILNSIKDKSINSITILTDLNQNQHTLTLIQNLATQFPSKRFTIINLNKNITEVSQLQNNITIIKGYPTNLLESIIQSTTKDNLLTNLYTTYKSKQFKYYGGKLNESK